MSTRTRCLLVAFLALAASPGLVSAQSSPATRAAQDPLTAIIAVDPQVRVGRLPNGLQYFVRANAAAARPRRAATRRQRRFGARGR